MQASHYLEAKWSPPKYPIYTINVDGAVFSSQKAADIAVVVRDHEGNFIVGLSKGAVEVEAKAFEANIFFAKEVGSREFILEGDSVVTV